MNMLKTITILAAAAVTLLTSTPSHAAVITWEITGTVSSVYDYSMNTVTAPFVAGDAFVHQFTVDDSVSPTSHSGTIGDTWATYHAVVSSVIQIPSRSFSATWDTPSPVDLVNYTVNTDYWGVAWQNPTAITHPIVGTGEWDDDVNFTGMGLTLDVVPGMASIHPLPMLQPDPAWPMRSYYLRWRGQEDARYTLNLSIDSFTEVPEPATMSLLGIGGLALLLRRSK